MRARILRTRTGSIFAARAALGPETWSTSSTARKKSNTPVKSWQVWISRRRVRNEKSKNKTIMVWKNWFKSKKILVKNVFFFVERNFDLNFSTFHVYNRLLLRQCADLIKLGVNPKIKVYFITKFQQTSASSCLVLRSILGRCVDSVGEVPPKVERCLSRRIRADTDKSRKHQMEKVLIN